MRQAFEKNLGKKTEMKMSAAGEARTGLHE